MGALAPGSSEAGPVADSAAPKRRERIACAAVVLLLLGVYLLTLTRNYHNDPVYHGMVVDGFRPDSRFFRAGHLLLFPVFRAWQSLWELFGYEGRSLDSAAWLNALAGAVAIGFLWASLQRVLRNLWVTIPLALLAGLGFGHWWVSVDAHGYSLPLLFLNIVLWLLIRGVQDEREGTATPVRRGLVIALLHGAAVLIHQMTVLAGPGVLAFLLLRRGAWRAKIRAAVTYVVVSTVLVGGTYVGVAVGARGVRSPAQFKAWLTSAQAEGPFGKPFHPAYLVPKFVRGFSQMFTWYKDDSSAAARRYLEGQLSLREAIKRCAILPLFIFWAAAGAVMLWLVMRCRSILRTTGPWPVALFVWGLTFFAFFSWWLFPDPWKWCFVLGPFLVLVTLSFRDFLERRPAGTQRRLAIALLWALAATSGVNNFVVRMWPESREKNNRVLLASHSLGGVMKPKDVLFSPYGRLVDYLEYFEGRRGFIIYYRARKCWREGDTLEQNRERVLASLEDEVRAVQADGGRVYIEQMFDPSIDDWLHPWTTYRYYFRWNTARHDMEERLRKYGPEQPFGEFSDVWVLGGKPNAKRPE